MVKTKAPYRNIYGKTVAKLVREKIVSFFLNMLIVLVSISLISGIGCVNRAYIPGFISGYKEYNAPDVILKYTSEEGWDQDKIDQIKGMEGVKNITSLFSLDQINENEDNYRLLVYNDLKEENGVGLPTLLEGEYPSQSLHQEEIDGVTYNVFDSLIVTDIKGRSNHQIGDYIKVNFLNNEMAIKVVGLASHSLYNSMQKERAMTEEEHYLNNVFFTNKEALGMFGGYLTTTDLYVSFNHTHEYLTKEYKNEINRYKDKVFELFPNNVKVLTLEDNTSYALWKSYYKKIDIISIILPFFFIAVCALVVVVIISRLIADERSVIACYFSLGVPPRRIYHKYLFFSLLSSTIGVILGYLSGNILMPRVVHLAYKQVFRLPTIHYAQYSPVGLVTSFLILLSTFLVTFFCVKLYLREKPADLMKAKAPKPGKRVLMERIGLIWNRLSFSFKNSVRNIFRHKKNLILTSFSIIGSTTLVFLGLSLNDCSNDAKSNPLFENVASTMGFISVVIVMYGVLLAALIIYAFTSMNIEERVREIAVLKVLGYRDIECGMFIYRELLIITVFSAALGIPVSMLAAGVAFDFLDFGSLSAIRWPTYVGSYFIIIVSTIVSCFLLFRKIKKVDFNISLKSLE